MVNKKPVLTVIIRDDDCLSLNEFCTVVITAIIRFIDEVDYGFSQAKHEVALRNWNFTGQRINVRQANEEQWWNFLLEEGLTGAVDDIRFHVIPPIAHNLLSENVRYCPDNDFNIMDEFDIAPKERELSLPILSILVEKNPKNSLLEYVNQAKDVALLNLVLARNNFAYETWARNNFAVNVGIVDLQEFSVAPAITIEKHKGHVNALGLWVEE